MRAAKRSHFDFYVLLAMVGLSAALVVVLVRGDQLGVSITRFDPMDTAASQVAIQITFDEPIDQVAAEQLFSIDPAIQGRLSVQQDTLTFRPIVPLIPGQEYTVSLGSGPIAVSGRALMRSASWHFRVRQARILYLGPFDIYAVDTSAPDHPLQLTHSQNGVLGFTVAADGSKIVYSEIEFSEGKSLGTTQLYLLDVATGKDTLLYTCDAACINLTLKPDGSVLAFDRIDLNANVGTGPGAPRVWLYDLETRTAHPLFSDSQRLGQAAHWSPDGSRLAMYSASEGGLIIHVFTTNQDTTIPNVDGQLGPFSPDGQWLYYSRIVVQDEGTAALHLVLLDLSKSPYTPHNLEVDTEAVSDIEAVWRADSKGLILARQIPARQLTEGAKVYNVELTSGAAALLILDDGMAQSNLALSPAGDLLLFQRLKEGDSTARPEIWLYAFDSGKLVRIAQDATSPAWLP